MAHRGVGISNLVVNGDRVSFDVTVDNPVNTLGLSLSRDGTYNIASEFILGTQRQIFNIIRGLTIGVYPITRRVSGTLDRTVLTFVQNRNNSPNPIQLVSIVYVDKTNGQRQDVEKSDLLTVPNLFITPVVAPVVAPVVSSQSEFQGGSVASSSGGGGRAVPVSTPNWQITLKQGSTFVTLFVSRNTVDLLAHWIGTEQQARFIISDARITTNTNLRSFESAKTFILNSFALPDLPPPVSTPPGGTPQPSIPGVPLTNIIPKVIAGLFMGGVALAFVKSIGGKK